MTRPPGAFLALWNSISSPALQPEYETWHTMEHVPERVGLPGFIEARRYRSWEPTANGTPLYFTCYWLDSLDALDSAPYRDVFTYPTPWSARMRTGLTDFFRLPCRLGGVVGQRQPAVYAASARRRGSDGNCTWCSAERLGRACRRGQCAVGLGLCVG